MAEKGEPHGEGKQGGAPVKESVALSVPSHPKYLYVIRSAVYPVVLDAGFTKKEARKIILALDEACSNVIRYAYEGDPSQRLQLDVALAPDLLRIIVRDWGRKPDVAKIAPRKLDDIRPGGLGTHFMAQVFDSVTYDTSGEQGTVLTLVKKRDVQSS